MTQGCSWLALKLWFFPAHVECVYNCTDLINKPKISESLVSYKVPAIVIKAVKAFLQTPDNSCNLRLFSITINQQLLSFWLENSVHLDTEEYLVGTRTAEKLKTFFVFFFLTMWFNVQFFCHQGSLMRGLVLLYRSVDTQTLTGLSSQLFLITCDSYVKICN